MINMSEYICNHCGDKLKYLLDLKPCGWISLDNKLYCNICKQKITKGTLISAELYELFE